MFGTTTVQGSQFKRKKHIDLILFKGVCVYTKNAIGEMFKTVIDSKI